jgi:hypothetical protein
VGNAGPIWLEGCDFTSGTGDLTNTGTASTVNINFSDSVMLSGCSIVGFDGVNSEGQGSLPALEGLTSSDSVVGLWACDVFGGDGAAGTPAGDPAGEGARAVIVSQSAGPDGVRDFYASGCLFAGGDVGDGRLGIPGGCVDGADGGAGLQLIGAEGVRMAPQLMGGAGGAAVPGCVGGSPGAAWEALGFPGAGSHPSVALGGILSPERRIETPPLTTVGATATFDAVGAGAEDFSLYTGALTPGLGFQSTGRAPLAIFSNTPPFLFGTLSGGAQSISGPAPGTNGMEALVLFGQGVFGGGTTAGNYLANPSVFVVLAPNF